MKPTALWGGALLALTTACFSPKPILQLQTSGAPSAWFYGKEVLTREVDDVRVSLIFDRWVGNELVFAAEIINRSSDTVLVAPETFFYETFRQGDTTALSNVHRALDPEREIMDIERTISRERAHRRNALVFDVALTAVVLTAELATQGHSDGEIGNNGGGVDVYFNSGSDNDIVFLNRVRQQWAYQALRKTSLPPGTALRGNVVFIDQPEAVSYTVYVPLEDRILSFNYRKQIIQP
ncbi:MAG: hypothetical protein WA960_00265 [Tunicatimonas sp.]